MLTGVSACLAGLFLPRDLRHCRLLSHLGMLTLAAVVSFLLLASVGSLAGVPPRQLARLSACGALPLAIGGAVCIQASRRGRREVGWCCLFWTLSLSALLAAWLIGS
jgi:predicted permease